MTEAEDRGSETEETAACRGKRSGHNVQDGFDGLPWVSSELGDIGTDPLTIWEALADGKTVTLRCRECGALLSVGLDVRPLS